MLNVQLHKLYKTTSVLVVMTFYQPQYLALTINMIIIMITL